MAAASRPKGLRRATEGPGAVGGGSPCTTAASYVAVGTGVSRLTGLLRIVALAWALGQSHLADAFNLANTTPNMLYDIVLGGVLSATFIPVFVEQLTTRDEEDAFGSISAVLSVSVVVLLTTSVAALVLAPQIITALTALDTSAHAHQIHQVLAERAVATTLLRWFVIQVAAYGLFALATALLEHASAVRGRGLGPHYQQRGLHRRAGLVRTVGGQGRRPGQRRAAPLAARPARPGHLARRGDPGPGPHPEPARAPISRCAGTGTCGTPRCEPWCA